MKRVIFLLLVFLSMGLFSQIYIKGKKGQPPINIDTYDSKFCVITVTHGFVSTRVTVAIEVGQKTYVGAFTNRAKRYILDEKSKKMKFNGLADVLNFMDKNGWLYLDNFLDGKKLNIMLKKKASD